MDIRDQSVGVVGAISKHAPLGVSWLVLALHSLCISWGLPPLRFLFSLADSLYPTENVAGRHRVERALALSCFPSKCYFSLLGQLEHSYSILGHVSVLVEKLSFVQYLIR